MDNKIHLCNNYATYMAEVLPFLFFFHIWTNKNRMSLSVLLVWLFVCFFQVRTKIEEQTSLFVFVFFAFIVKTKIEKHRMRFPICPLAGEKRKRKYFCFRFPPANGQTGNQISLSTFSLLLKKSIQMGYWLIIRSPYISVFWTSEIKTMNTHW